MNRIDLSEKIERQEDFEKKHGVRIENATAWFEDNRNWLSVFFELHPSTGNTIPQNMKIVITIYNNKNQIIDSDEEMLLANKFWGFAVGNRGFKNILPKDISKVSIYPILW